MRALIRISIIFVSTLFVSESYGYEQPTHRTISSESYSRSILSQQDILKDYGLPSDSPNFASRRGERKSISGLIEDGADFEDIERLSLLKPTAFRNHFFDPQGGGAGLNNARIDSYLSGIPTTANPSPHWALEDNGELGNEYSMVDANDYFEKALTLPNKNKESGPFSLVYGRDNNWALLFETIGRVIHHIQDMAQPQHTRNDPHCPAVVCRHFNEHNFDPTLYETHAQKRNERAGGLVFSGYPNVRYNEAINYWRHKTKEEGMAYISSYQFVSNGTNFSYDNSTGAVTTHPNYNFPVVSSSVQIFTSSDVFPDTSFSTPGNFYFFGNTWADGYSITPYKNDYLSTLSIYDSDLRVWTSKSGPLVFTLNRKNIDQALDFLVPMAVGHSAGFIDYFFRGRFEVVDFKIEGGMLEIDIKNISHNGDVEGGEANAKSFDLENGLVRLYYESTDGARKSFESVGGAGFVASGNGAQLSGAWSYGEKKHLSAILPDDVDFNHETPFIVVYRGDIGEEEGIAAIVLSESMHGIVANSPTGGKFLTNNLGTWDVQDSEQIATGNIDWKGWYENGQPTKVLSWMGPQTRYFGDFIYRSPLDPLDQREVFSQNIYQNGEIFSVAPSRVLGSAITKITNELGEEEEWIVAITNEGDVGAYRDVVYVRPNIKSSSNALFDSEAQPNGWRKIAEFPWAQNTEITGGWFFKGDGSEAQAIRYSRTQVTDEFGNNGEASVLDRYKIELSGIDSASFTNLGNDRGLNVSTVIAVDYNNLEERLLKLSDKYWLETPEGSALIPEEELEGVSCFSYENPKPNVESCNSVGGPDLAHTTSIHKQTGIYAANYRLSSDGGTYSEGNILININYLDIRSNSVSYYVMNDRGALSLKYKVGGQGGTVTAVEWPIEHLYYNILYRGKEYVHGFSNAHMGAFFLYDSPKYSNWRELEGKWAVGPKGNIALSVRNLNGSEVLNYISGGNIETLLGVAANSEIQGIGVK